MNRIIMFLARIYLIASCLDAEAVPITTTPGIVLHN
jgi:hypothetical protein